MPLCLFLQQISGLMAEASTEHEEAQVIEKEIWDYDLPNLTKAPMQEQLPELRRCRDLWSGQVQELPP